MAAAGFPPGVSYVHAGLVLEIDAHRIQYREPLQNFIGEVQMGRRSGQGARREIRDTSRV